MNNKDFIKKSIEENIVDKQTVINNMKAKAAVLEVQRSRKTQYRVGLHKFAAAFVLLILSSACIAGSSYVFNNNNGICDNACSNSYEIISDTEDIDCSKPHKINGSEDTENKSIGKNETVSNIVSESVISDESREFTGKDESGDIIIETPLNDQLTGFFNQFADKFNVFQCLINARLDYNDTLLEEEYVPVNDDNFKCLKDIKHFLYSFIKPELAGEMYNKLTCGDVPLYTEQNEILYIYTQAPDNKISGIFTDTAFIFSESEDTLVISAMLDMNTLQNYYHSFNFKNVDGRWLYADNWNS